MPTDDADDLPPPVVSPVTSCLGVLVAVLGLGAGLLALAGELVDLPGWLVVVALVLFVLGVTGAIVVAVRDARARGRSVGSMLRAALAAPFRFFADWF